MIDKIRNYISSNNLIQAGEHVIIGVSGGPDSICLLHVLFQIREELNFNMTAVHVNHQLRGQEAIKDQEYTVTFCKSLGIDCELFICDVLSIASEEGRSTEEAGRQVRYKAFYEVMERKGAHKIAVAQNLNDQGETLIMRIMRGTGLDGISGIDPIRDGVIVRPLLCIDRNEIEEYCYNNKLEPVIDKTNLEPLYTRNKIRLELIPYMEKNFNENIIYALERLANSAREDKSFIYDTVDKYILSDGIIENGKGKFPLNIIKYLHIAVKKRIVIKMFELIGLNQDISSVHLDSAMELMDRGITPKSLDFPSGYRLQISYDHLIFTNIKHEISKDFSYFIRLNGSVQMPEINATIIAEEVDNTSLNLKDDYTKYFDLASINGNICLRSRKPGDRFTPLGMKGSKKLKDFFIDEKIPKSERDTIPLLCFGNEVIWVVGYRINDKYRIDKESKGVVRVEFKRGLW